MSTILSPRPDDRPPQHEDWGKGVTISVVAHLALVGALIWGVHWKSNSEPDGGAAELWAAVPEAQAPPPDTAPPPATPAPTPAPAPRPVPRPPAPPPPPPVAAPKAPDIVTERLQEKKKLKEQQERQEQLEQQAKLDKAKADQAKADQAKADADKKQAAQQKQLDAQKLAKLHEENLKRMMGQMDAPADATGTAARSAGPSAGYAGRIKARILPNIVLTDDIDGNPQTEVEVRCAPDGTIIGRRITQSSGVKAWDDTVLRAIDKTQVLPRDTDGRVPSPMTLVFRPQDKL
jgi:colicin import membrane protein